MAVLVCDGAWLIAACSAVLPTANKGRLKSSASTSTKRIIFLFALRNFNIIAPPSSTHRLLPGDRRQPGDRKGSPLLDTEDRPERHIVGAIPCGRPGR